LEEIKTSFELVTQPDDKVVWEPNKALEAKTRPEALVKGITPSQPAPVSAPSAPAAAAGQQGPGLLKRLINWLTGGDQKAEAPAAAEPAGKAAHGNRSKGSRSHDQRRERSSHGERGRSRRGDRRQDASSAKAEDHQAPVQKPRRPAQQDAPVA